MPCNWPALGTHVSPAQNSLPLKGREDAEGLLRPTQVWLLGGGEAHMRMEQRQKRRSERRQMPQTWGCSVHSLPELSGPSGLGLNDPTPQAPSPGSSSWMLMVDRATEHIILHSLEGQVTGNRDWRPRGQRL